MKIVEKVPPNAPTAEMAVLGSMMIEKKACDAALAIVEPEWFYHEPNRILFRALSELREDGRGVDMVIALEYLKDRGLLEKVGGESQLAEMVAKVSTAAHVIYYCGIVRERWLDRQILAKATEIAQSGSDDWPALAEKLRRYCVERETSGKVAVHAIDKGIHDWIDSLGKRAGGSELFTSGYPTIDNRIGFLMRGDWLTIGARPNQGKTVMAIEVALHLATKHKLRGIFFTGEMKFRAILERMMSNRAEIPHSRIRVGKLDERDWQKLTNAAGDLADLNLAISDEPQPSIQQIEAAVLSYRADFVVLDYLQRCTFPNSSKDPRWNINAFLKRWDTLLAQHGLIGVMVSQFSREIEKDRKRSPRLSDLAESGNIEQDSDSVVLLHNPEPENEKPDGAELEAIVAKSKFGAKGIVPLTFNKRILRIRESYQDDQTELGGGDL